MLPRMIWIDKGLNLKQLHLKVFSSFKHILGEWIDWKDTNSGK